MKIRIIMLPFLCTVGVAMAQGIEKEGAADQPQAASAPAQPVATPAERAAAQAAPSVAPVESAAMPGEPVAAPAESTAAPAKAPAKAKAASRSRVGKQGPRRLPTGDMRHCLDMKTRAEIIRCSETRPKK